MAARQLIDDLRDIRSGVTGVLGLRSEVLRTVPHPERTAFGRLRASKLGKRALRVPTPGSSSGARGQSTGCERFRNCIPTWKKC